MSQHALAILVNLFLPGIGSLMAGKTIAGVIQIIISVFCLIFVIGTAGLGLVIFGPIEFLNWLWAVVTTVMALDRKRASSLS